MIGLKDISGIVNFNESEHTYTRLSDGKQLTGVTTMMRLVGVSADYSSVPQEVLDAAADRGTMVHRLCEKTHEKNADVDVFDEIDVYDILKSEGILKSIDTPYGMEQANEYRNLITKGNYIHIQSEYLVSDMENIASSVDVVLTTEELAKKNSVILVDIKTTSSIHHEALSWQLSIYKDLFEKQNPDIKVEAVYGIWLPKPQYGTSMMFKENQKTAEEVSRLVECLKNGETYAQLPDAIFCPPDNIMDSFKEYLEAKNRIRRDTEIVKKFEDNLLKMFEDNDVKKWDFDNASFTRTLPTTRKSFDSKAFEKDNPELYAQYIKESTTKSSLRVTIK